jgi:hypothetical protein
MKRFHPLPSQTVSRLYKYASGLCHAVSFDDGGEGGCVDSKPSSQLLLFPYRDVLKKPLGLLIDVIRANKFKRSPIILTGEDIIWTYEKRWAIAKREKDLKQLLGLSQFQNRSYEAGIILRFERSKSVHTRLVHSGGSLGVFLRGDVLDYGSDRRLIIEV